MTSNQNPSPSPKTEIRHGLETGAAKPDNASETAGGPTSHSQVVTEGQVEAAAKAIWEARNRREGGSLLWEQVIASRKDFPDTYFTARLALEDARLALMVGAIAPQNQAPVERTSKRDRQRLQSVFKKGVKEGRRLEREAHQVNISTIAGQIEEQDSRDE